ncbi:MAG TPA: hypothetical protein VHT75_17750 [Acidimicrobiales bacterium]|jgi:hypothetical protein|nr:hypothetical protein [Acidimicrobiales bacterium]
MDDERGSVTLWLVIMTVALIAAIGLVYDGGEALAVKGQAISDAYGAARAGAQALDVDQFARGGPAAPNAGAAVSAASTFLSAAGVAMGQATIAVNGPVVTVTVRLTSPATILGAVGARSFRLTGTGSARAIYGVRGPQP